MSIELKVGDIVFLKNFTAHSENALSKMEFNFKSPGKNMKYAMLLLGAYKNDQELRLEDVMRSFGWIPYMGENSEKLSTAIEVLDTVREWLENDGFISDVHMDQASILDEINRVLDEETAEQG